MSNRQRTSFIVLLIITCLYTLFIWSNSIMSADISSFESEGVRAFINNILKNLGFTFQLTSQITRKLAHFSEFALLGFLSVWTVSRVYKLIINNPFVCIPIGLIVAIIDECIQLFSPGRACQITDICIDLTGVLTGISIFYIMYKLIKIFINKGKSEKGNGKKCSEK